MIWNITLAILPSLDEDHISFFKKKIDFPFPPNEFKFEFMHDYNAKIKLNDCTLKTNGEFEVFVRYQYTDNKADEEALKFLTYKEILEYSESLKQVNSYNEFLKKIINTGWEKWEVK